MLHIAAAVELDTVVEYLVSRDLLTAYRKAKGKLLAGVATGLDFKKRKPRTLNVYQFRINQKYRAFGHFDEKDPAKFVVFRISDHQD